MPAYQLGRRKAGCPGQGNPAGACPTRLSWGGQAWGRAMCTLPRCSALAWALRTVGITQGSEQAGQTWRSEGMAEARDNQTGEGLGQTCRLWPGGQVADL